MFEKNITTVEQMEAWIAERRPDLKGAEPANGEEMSMTRVGKDLYEKVKKNYKKQSFVERKPLIVINNFVLTLIKH